MFFRRLNWNIVGWFRIVSMISYLDHRAGLRRDDLQRFQGRERFSAVAHAALGLSFTGGTDIAVKFTQPATADKVKRRSRVSA